MGQSLRFGYFVLFVVGFCQAKSPACKNDDHACLLSTVNTLYAKIIGGDSSIGLEPMDPTFIPMIDGSMTMLNFKLTDTTIAGFKNCKLTDIIMNVKQNELKLSLQCPELKISGKYSMDGHMIDLPVNGNGDATITLYSYTINSDIQYEILKTQDGKEYMQVTSSKFDANTDKGGQFQFDNLSDAVHKFANENSKEVAQLFEGPIFAAEFDLLKKSINNFLKANPSEHLFL